MASKTQRPTGGTAEQLEGKSVASAPEDSLRHSKPNNSVKIRYYVCCNADVNDNRHGDDDTVQLCLGKYRKLIWLEIKFHRQLMETFKIINSMLGKIKYNNLCFS
jgi:hypothetical protein